MFYDSLLESVPEQRPRRCLATLISFVLQSAGLGALLLIPLWYTGVLPPMPTPNTTFFAPAMVSREDFVELMPGDDSAESSSAMIYPSDSLPQIRKPGGPKGPHGPIGLETGVDAPPICFACPVGPLGPSPITEIVKPLQVQVIPVHVEQKPFRVSHMDEGMLLVRVEPQYPRNAILTRTQGEVIMAATISRDGRIEQLRVLKGSPFLSDAAMNAVRQWRYRPYVLNEQAVEVETLITVDFHLSQ